MLEKHGAICYNAGTLRDRLMVGQRILAPFI